MMQEQEFPQPYIPIGDNKVVPKKPGIAGLFDAEGQLFFITYSLTNLQTKLKQCPYKPEATHFSFLIFHQKYTYRELRPNLKALIEKKQPRRNKRFNPHYNATKPTIKSLEAKIEQLQAETEAKERGHIAEIKALHQKIDDLLKLVTALIKPNSPNKPTKQKTSEAKARPDSSYRLHAVGDSLLRTGQEEQATNIASRESVKPPNSEKLLPVVVSKTFPVVAASEVQEQPEVERSLYQKAIAIFRRIRWGMKE